MSDNTIEKKFLHHSGILDTFDEVLEESVWDQSPLLKIYKKRLQEIRDNFSSQLDFDNYMQNNKVQDNTSEATGVGQLAVYISVYNTNGGDLDKWNLILNGLASGVVNRPVYRVEEDVRQLIRSKNNPANEGYLKLNINNSDIVQSSQPSLDPLGVELTVLKDGAIKQSNYIEFIHTSGTYVFKNKKLMSKDLI